MITRFVLKFWSGRWHMKSTTVIAGIDWKGNKNLVLRVLICHVITTFCSVIIFWATWRGDSLQKPTVIIFQASRSADGGRRIFSPKLSSCSSWSHVRRLLSSSPARYQAQMHKLSRYGQLRVKVNVLSVYKEKTMNTPSQELLDQIKKLRRLIYISLIHTLSCVCF